MLARSLRPALFVSLLVAGGPALAQVTLQPADLVGTWELVASRNFKDGKANDTSRSTYWMQFTKGHWSVMSMRLNRPALPAPAEFEKLTDAQKMKANYSTMWNDKHQQLFAARSGTYVVKGDGVHQLSKMAVYGPNVGVERVLRIVRMDKNTLVARTEYPDQPQLTNEMTFKRLD